MSCPAQKLNSCVRSRFTFRVSFFFPILIFGCGAPGEPTPRTPPVPAAITDVTAHQAGDGVQLTFTVPTKSMAGDRLLTVPAIEILRGPLKPDGAPDIKSFRVVYTIPGAMVPKYLSDGSAEFTDPIAPQEIKAHSGAAYAYLVRTRASQKKVSVDSNLVSVRVFPVPEKIASVETRVTENVIELNWPAATHTSAGDLLTAPVTYHLYRGELDPVTADAAYKDVSQAKWKSKLDLLASPVTNRYSDASFDFGKTYYYLIRSVTAVGTTSLESDDSNPAIITPRDIFPPAPPQNLAAAILPGAERNTLQVDLSWSINLETDLAGYYVYRSEEQGTPGQRITPNLLPTPSIRDTSVQAGHRYWYTVTAIDRTGNESAPSPAISVDVAQPVS